MMLLSGVHHRAIVYLFRKKKCFRQGTAPVFVAGSVRGSSGGWRGAERRWASEESLGGRPLDSSGLHEELTSRRGAAGGTTPRRGSAGGTTPRRFLGLSPEENAPDA